MSNNSQPTAVYTDYKHCCVIDAEGSYSDFVQVHIYTLPDGSTEDRVQHYTLKPGERIVDAMTPTSKLYAGAAGFIRPVWDDIASAWVEAATPEEIVAWEAEHPIPPPGPPTVEERMKLVEAQIGATNDRMDFNEDCMAEMAGQVYNV